MQTWHPRVLQNIPKTKLISELLAYSLHLRPLFRANHSANALDSNPEGNTE